MRRVFLVEGTAQAHTWSTDEARYISRPEPLKQGGEQKDGSVEGSRGQATEGPECCSDVCMLF